MNLVRQKDSMQCGVAALTMVSRHFGASYDMEYIEEFCVPTNRGISLRGISDGARKIGLNPSSARMCIENLSHIPLPCILHWNQNHFVVLYKISRDGKKFHIADSAKGKYTCSEEEMRSNWISIRSDGMEKGIGMFFEKTGQFDAMAKEYKRKAKPVSGLIRRYIRGYRPHLAVVCLGLLLGCVLQLIMPFLTQSIVDVGIRHEDIGFIWLILLGELMIVAGRTATDFIRRWLLLHISMRVNISLVSDFFIKLLRLPMSFFDTKLMGDLLQRIGDHNRFRHHRQGARRSGRHGRQDHPDLAFHA